MGDLKKKRQQAAAFSRGLTPEEQAFLQKIGAFLTEHGLEFNDLLQQELPLSIFSTRLTPLEAIVKHLRQQHTLREIATLLKRDERNIWHIDKKAAEKHPTPLPLTDSQTIPLHIFTTQFSALEALVKYLREEQQLRYREIATLLQRNERTIWTVYRRAEQRGGDQQ